MNTLLSPEQVAKALRKGATFVRGEIRAGRLRAFDLRGVGASKADYKIDPRDVETYLASRVVEAEYDERSSTPPDPVDDFALDDD
jgi:hypothetical protein